MAHPALAVPTAAVSGHDGLCLRQQLQLLPNSWSACLEARAASAAALGQPHGRLLRQLLLYPVFCMPAAMPLMVMSRES